MTDHEMASVRHLSSKQAEFDSGSQMAQLFSGALFSALVVYLIFSNSTRLSYIQRASLEKRLNVVCQISTIVAALSAFLNFFQVTEVDNWFLPGSRDGFTVDVARPLEWILTCPLMQLNLVLMGGSRIPEQRLVMMPSLAAIVLFFGTLTLFLDTPLTYVSYGCGLCFHMVAMYFNRKQIIEHSRGVEGLLSGDSEFRKASLILMGTWFPFPIWYMLSPEGVGLVTDITLIQLGWAFLNITSKFTLIFYLQRIKDNYCNRLKVKREMKGTLASANQQLSDFVGEDGEEVPRRKVNGELSACVVETMNYLGMAENVERFLRLLQDAQICTLDEVALIRRDDAEALQLPWDLVTAIQKRHRVWALEMVDDAEKGLEAGEKHYKKATPPAFGPRLSDVLNTNGFPIATSALVKQPPSPANADAPVVFSKITENANGSPTGLTNGILQAMPTGSNNEQSVNSIVMANENFANGFGNDQVHAVAVVVHDQVHAVKDYSNNQDVNGFGNAMYAGNGYSNKQSNILPQGDNSIPKVAPTYSVDLSAMEKKLETRLEKLEGKLLEKFENVVENVAQAVGKQIGQSQDQFGSGLQDVRNSMERSQALLEAKVEYVFAAQSKEHRQNVNADMQGQLEQLAVHLNQNVATSHDSTTASLKIMQEGLTGLTKQLEDLQVAQNSVSTIVGGSITQMTDGWAQQIIQESKAAAFTLQTKLSVMEEIQQKKNAESEERISSKIQQVVHDSVGTISGVVAERAQSSAEQLQACIEGSKTFNINEHSKLDEKMSRMLKDITTDCSKSVEAGIGVFGNSVRAQLDTMQATQLAQRHESESNITTKMDGKLDSLLNHMQRDGQRQIEKMGSVLEANIRENAERSTVSTTEGLKDFQKSIENATRSQHENAQEVHSAIAFVNAGTAECVDKLAALCEHCQLDPRTVHQSPGRPNTAGFSRGPGGSGDGGAGGRSKHSSKFSQYGMQSLGNS